MKKILFLMAILPMMLFTACSSDDDEPQILLSKSAIIGKWSTGTSGIHKYVDFDSDGTGYYALFNGTNIGQNYLFSYKVSDKSITIEITYSETKGIIGKVKQWNCNLSENILTIENETENGVYKRTN